jgi:hypothetical protein
MAYAPGIRVNYFSNPDVLHNGVSTGQAIGVPNQASNAASINFVASTVAGWRESIVDARIVPPDGFHSMRNPGGRLVPPAKVYTIIDSGVGAVGWTVTGDQDWFDVVSPGQPSTWSHTRNVKVTLNNSASQLTPGRHVGTIRFRDDNDVLVETRSVVLDIDERSGPGTSAGAGAGAGSGDSLVIWVDFAQTEAGIGTEVNPFRAIFGAVHAARGRGSQVVRIKGDTAVSDSGETMSIVTPMTIESIGGAVQIGVVP